jgi:RNA polymerase sigma-70 factor (TIGR02943 family)
MTVKSNPPHLPSDPSTWVDQYSDRLYRYALLKMHDPSRAEDMVQEALLAALNSRKNFNGQSPELNWMLGILNHKIIDYFRQAHREHPAEDIIADLQDDKSYFNKKGMWMKGPVPWKSDPSEAASQQEFWKVLHECLQALPERASQAFLLREVDDYSFAEICQELNISNSNYWVIMHRTRLQLRQCLEGNWFALPKKGAN